MLRPPRAESAEKTGSSALRVPSPSGSATSAENRPQTSQGSYSDTNSDGCSSSASSFMDGELSSVHSSHPLFTSSINDPQSPPSTENINEHQNPDISKSANEAVSPTRSEDVTHGLDNRDVASPAETVTSNTKAHENLGAAPERKLSFTTHHDQGIYQNLIPTSGSGGNDKAQTLTVRAKPPTIQSGSPTVGAEPELIEREPPIVEPGPVVKPDPPTAKPEPPTLQSGSPTVGSEPVAREPPIVTVVIPEPPTAKLEPST